MRVGYDVAATVALGRATAIVDPVHGFVEAAEDKELETCYAEGQSVRRWGWQSRGDAPQDRLGPAAAYTLFQPMIA